LMSLHFPCSFAINQTQQLSLFADGSGFVFNHKTIAFDFHYEQKGQDFLIVLNDDASWGLLSLADDVLQGTLFSYISEPQVIHWSLKSTELISKPQSTSALQAIRFHDKKALTLFSEKQGIEEWSQWLIEAATCGHEDMVKICIEHEACLHVNIETYKEEKHASCLALTKAIQCGHLKVVKQLLDAKAHIHHHSFDLDRDNFYHACYLYQCRPDVASEIITLLLVAGVDFSHMSAYYLCAVMYIFPEGPLHKAKEDTSMLIRLIDAGAKIDDFLTINAQQKDTAFMFAAHMGLLNPLKVLAQKGVNIFESYRGINALHRVLYPAIIDPLMPRQGDESIKIYLEDLGLELQEEVVDLETTKEDVEVREEDISSLEALFKNLNR